MAPRPPDRVVPVPAARLVERVAHVAQTPGYYALVHDGRGRYTARFELHWPITHDRAVDILIEAGCDYWSIEAGAVRDGRRRYIIGTVPTRRGCALQVILVFTEAE